LALPVEAEQGIAPLLVLPGTIAIDDSFSCLRRTIEGDLDVIRGTR